LYRITTDGGTGNHDIKVGHEYASGRNQFFTFNTNLSLDTWYHLVVVRNTSQKTWELYVDAVFIGKYDYTSNATGGTSATLNLGVEGSYYFDGNIDEVAIFDASMAPAGVSAIYNSGVPTDLSGESNLVGYWRMGDPDGTSSYPTITDQSSNSNDGTMTNMASGDIVTDVP